MANAVDNFNNVYNQMLAKFSGNLGYQPQSASTLKDSLSRIIRPGYQKEINARQKTAKANRAAIDADAASRGLGSSTWVTDVKNRQNDALASDIKDIESDYQSTLYSNLMNRLQNQDEMSLQARMAAQNNAMSAAGQLYNQLGTGGGGGGWSRGSVSPKTSPDKDLDNFGLLKQNAKAGQDLTIGTTGTANLNGVGQTVSRVNLNGVGSNVSQQNAYNPTSKVKATNTVKKASTTTKKYSSMK